MAASHDLRPGSRNRLSYGIGTGDIEGQRVLPVGSCNFRDLSIGARAPTCGCTRFWLNVNNFNNNDGNSFCFCGHHACFHDALGPQQQIASSSAALHSSSYAAGVVVNTGISNADKQNPTKPTSEPRPTGLGIRSDLSQQQPSINVRVWEALNAFARDQEHEPGSGNTSKLPSTAAPSVVEDSRRSPNRVLQERSQHHRSMRPPVHIPYGYTNVVTSAEEYSATEVATPSIAGTPDFRGLAVPGHLVHESRPKIQPQNLVAADSSSAAVRQSVEVPLQDQRTHITRTQPIVASTHLTSQTVQHLLQSYGRRIETLESLSFSQLPIEEVQEKMELFDGRLLDLEQWRGDQEHCQERHSMESPPIVAVSSKKRRRLLPAESCSFESDASFDLSAAANTEAAVMATLVANAETLPRIEALESRIADLEDSSLPSFARPWQVEIVLLPWGRDLRGVWFSSEDSTQRSMRNSVEVSEEWSGACSVPRLSFKSSTSAAWTTESIQAWADEATDWLSPKACGPTGTVFQRLASRGLVQDVSLTSSDSRHVLDTIASTFSNVLRSKCKDGESSESHYQGLREYFIPLRKVRKSSRLRFLSPAEMVTSSTWNAEFLDSSVFMKVNDGQRRLYITTSDGYKQQMGPVWSWSEIRQLPLYDASGEEQAAQATNVAIEACWSYHDRLDQSTSIHTSFAESQWSARSQPGHEKAREQDNNASPPLRQSYKHQRTVSLPSSLSMSDHLLTGAPKRRVASFETIRTVPHHMESTQEVSATKRRRISSSPEAERRGVGFTPRYSREPPSPFTTSDPAYEARSQATSGRKRGNTPFAYATPHSNNNLASRIGSSLVGGDGDTEPDTDVLPRGQNEGEKVEEEWNGVDEDMQTSDDDIDLDEDNLDDDEEFLLHEH